MISAIASTCNDAALSGILSVVKNILSIIGIVVPIMLMLWSMYGVFQLMQNPEMKNGVKNIVNKFVAALFVFMIPILLNTVMGLAGESTKFSNCWNNPRQVSAGSGSYIPIDNSQSNRSKIPSGSDYEKGKKKLPIQVDLIVQDL